MKFELLILGVTAFFVANTYYDGNLIKSFNNYKKYYQMAGIAFIGLSFYLFLKKHPDNSHDLLKQASSMVRYMPIDKESSDFLSPVLNFSKNYNSNIMSQSANSNQTSYVPQHNINRILNSGKKNNKRSVSETKKKFVASRQEWKCAKCNKLLPAWFETDHIIELQNGGTNNVDNLEALCRDCHGYKTSLCNL